jgi:cytochrome c5
LAWTLLAAVALAATLPHRHLALSDDSAVERPGENVVTRHDPRSHALHWHAILKIVQEEACWACHWNRILGAPAAGGTPERLAAVGRWSALPARASLSVARYTRLSRGPPALL